MLDLLCAVDSPHAITEVAPSLRSTAVNEPIPPRRVLEIFELWSAALGSSEMRDIPGVTFLRLWLRRSALEPLLARELGTEFLDGHWQKSGKARLRCFPLGLVGHWPAGNIEIQPVLSLTCALLGGNSSIVRVPSASVGAVQMIVEKLQEVDSNGDLLRRVALAFFDHASTEMHQAMARAVDGAMIWGGAEAVTTVRELPFPASARLVVFGPRLSVAAMDGVSWSDSAERRSWCQRIARDVWQFDQQACSSPQALFLERRAGHNPADFVADLKRAFDEENRAHPRREIDPSLTSAICRARASWLMSDQENEAWFPQSPDWTILLGQGSEIPKPTQGKTLTVLVADDLGEVISKFDGTVQTLGVAIKDKSREEAIAQTAGFHGVDRVVRIGQMHTFGSPWDGSDLVRPMVRMVRHLPSQLGE
jgi:hypothetical protein